MDLKAILAKIRQMTDDTSFVNEAEGYLENLQKQATEGDKATKRLGELQSENESLKASKNEALNDAVHERKSRQALQDTLKPFIDAGLVTKENKPALDDKALTALKDSGARIKELETKVSGFEQKERQGVLRTKLETIAKEKGYTSGMKLLLQVAEQKGGELNLEDDTALTTLVAETVTEYGEELFTATPKAKEGDKSDAGDGEKGKDDKAKDNKPGTEDGKKHVVTPNQTGIQVRDAGNGQPSRISLAGGAAGVDPNNPPTFAEYLKQEREGQNLTVPRVVAQRVSQADAEREARQAKEVGNGADKVSDITDAVK